VRPLRGNVWRPSIKIVTSDRYADARPALVATMGGAARFPSAAHFRSFTGLAPKASETGNTDRKGQAMSKAGNSLLRTTWSERPIRPAKKTPSWPGSTTYRWPSAARPTWPANCVVAAHLAERAWLVMRRGTPYVLFDIDGRVVTLREAKAIIADRYTVTEDVRRRQRSKKGGKAPQKVLSERLKSHAQGVDRTRRPSPTNTPARTEIDVKRTA
jgi:Transposase IS116/IS110/IS902 family